MIGQALEVANSAISSTDRPSGVMIGQALEVANLKAGDSIQFSAKSKG